MGRSLHSRLIGRKSQRGGKPFPESRRLLSGGGDLRGCRGERPFVFMLLLYRGFGQMAMHPPHSAHSPHLFFNFCGEMWPSSAVKASARAGAGLRPLIDGEI
jgi:hypothetical protein